MTATGTGLGWLEDVEVDADGSLYIADYVAAEQAHRVSTLLGDLLIPMDVHKVDSFSGPGGAFATDNLYAAMRLALAESAIFNSDYDANRVHATDNMRVTTTVAGNGSDIAGGDGLPALLAGLPSPSGLALDQAGNVYVASGGRIRKFAGLADPTAPAPVVDTTVAPEPPAPEPTTPPTPEPEPTTPPARAHGTTCA